MRTLSTLILAISCFFSAPLIAADAMRYDYDFNQERMYVAPDQPQIFLISTFDTMDGLTVYNEYTGQKLWEVTFHAKIVSWSVQDDAVFVFSKARDGHKTYLTALDRATGRKLWERP